MQDMVQGGKRTEMNQRASCVRVCHKLSEGQDTPEFVLFFFFFVKKKKKKKSKQMAIRLYSLSFSVYI